MNTMTLETENAKAALLDNYFGLMKGLSREHKMQLAAKLTNEIAAESDGHTGEIDMVDKFCGAWKSEKDADEIIAEIHADRTFTRVIESF
jgi:hypothetical protein